MADENDIDKILENIKETIDDMYIVENLKTGEKYVTDYIGAISAIYGSEPYFDVWNSIPNPDLKMYSVKSLGPAGEVLYGSKKP